MCDFGAGDMEIAKVWQETVRRAAKAHRCSACGTTIQWKEYHLEHVSILDSVSRERMCFACWWVREDFHQEHAGSPSIMPSMLEEFLSGCLGWDDDGSSRWAQYLEQLRARRAARVAGEA